MSFRKVIIVSGGAGFIGSHLVESLLKNYDVLCIDNYSTGRKENLDGARMIAEARGTKLVCHENDVSSERFYEDVSFALKDFFDGQKVWAYVNLACPASPVAYQIDPISTLDTCYVGVKNAMIFAKMGARVIHASTSEIYGDPEVHPQHETYKGSVNTWGPRACYDEGKRVAETLCYEHLKKGYDVRVVRIFNTYGPRMQEDDGRVVSNFIVQSLKNNDITIYGDGSQTRSFCFVTDLVRGILSYLHKDKPHHVPINLGNPSERTVRSVAELVVELTETQSKVIYNPLPQDDPRRRNPDIRTAKEILNWSPNVSFEDGVRKTIHYFKNRIKKS